MGMCQSKILEKVKPPEKKKKPILCGEEKIEGELFTLPYFSLVACGIIDQIFSAMRISSKI